jgi:hypothetical protein
MVAAVREGKLEASELAGSMGRVLPIASAMGVRFDEVGAAFAALSRTGTNAAEAATQVRGIMSSLLRPTKQAEEALTGMGLSSEGLRTQLREEGLLATLQTLSDKFAGNEAAAASVFGNIRALSGVMDLMGENVATTEQIFASMTDTTGVLDKAFAVTSETAEFKFSQAMADMKTMLVDVGTAVLPIVLTLLEGVQTMVSAFGGLPGPLKLAAAAMVAFVIASGPIGQIALAVGGLLYVVGKMGEEAKKAKTRQQSLTDEFKAALTDEFKAANDPASTMIDRMKEMADAIEDVGDESEGLDKRFDTLIGSQTAMSMAMDNEVLGAFGRLELSMDHVALAAKNGTDLFQDMQDTYQDFGPDVEKLREHLVGLEGAEAAVATRLIDAMEAGTITRDEFLKMIDVVDETADAFDDQREALAENAEEFIKSADAAKLLNNANVDGEKLLGEWAEAGIGYVQQAQMISAITLDLTDQVDNFSVEAERAGIKTGEMGAAAGETEPLMADLTEEIGLTAETTRELFEDFSKLMGMFISEGQAINNSKLLMAEFDDIIAGLTDSNGELIGTLPELRQQYYDMATEASTALDELVQSGLDVDSPEVQAATTAFLASLDVMAETAQINTTEFDRMHDSLSRMVGMVVPITIDVTENVHSAVSSFDPQARIGDTYYGASGGVVTKPTLALIGESGPEAVVPLSQSPGSMPLDEFSGSGSTVINVTSQATPADIEAAVKFAMLSSPY